MASLGLDLGDDDILNDGNDGSAPLHSGRGTRAAVRHTRAPASVGLRCHVGPTPRTHGAFTRRWPHARSPAPRRVLEANLNPTGAAVSRSATYSIARGRCRPPGQQAGCTLCEHVEDTSPTRGLCFTV